MAEAIASMEIYSRAVPEGEMQERVLLAALDLEAGSGIGARPVDIADMLGVSRPAVTRAVQSLAAAGYVTYRKYRGMKFTTTGVEAVMRARDRYEVARCFVAKAGLEVADQWIRKQAAEAPPWVIEAMANLLAE